MHIRELHLLTDNIEQTRAFYAGLLGLQLAEESESQLVFRLPYSLLVFQRSNNESPCYHFAFNIPSGKIEQALSWTRSRTVLLPVEGENPVADFRNWNAKAIYFLDNNSNIVELIARDDLNNGDDAAFSSASLLSISEIGLVVPEVGQACQTIEKVYGIPFFSRQPPLPNFAALGDDNGLLILVSQGRPWYPTTIPAFPHWQRIVFDGQDGQQVIEYGPLSK
ncbi:MAG TPA: hypothetical protein VFR58_08165 [Flavisolibacter sp.]|nr:hypothetical protein [Flavisolibacter sp.]